jgi:hypothetical protein
LQLEAAIGEALFASTLATITLTNQVATGRLSHDQAAMLLDDAMLVLERHRGANAANASAVDYARTRLNAVLTLLNQLRPVTTKDAETTANPKTLAAGSV